MTINAASKITDGGYGRLYHACRLALGAIEAEVPDLMVSSPMHLAPSTVRFTMWDTTECPYPVWKYAKAFIVPCLANKELLQRHTRKPVEICPLFSDVSFAHLPPARPFRFICVARARGHTECKGIAQLIQLFTKAFPREQDVELIIKQSPECLERWSYDKRIIFNNELLSREDYVALLHSAHCGVFLSGFEGWNLPLLELMSAGRPSLCIPFIGPADFTTSETSYHLPFKLERAPLAGYRGVGFGARAHDLGVIHALRAAYEDQIGLAARGIASARAAQNYTVPRFAARLRAIVSKYADI